VSTTKKLSTSEGTLDEGLTTEKEEFLRRGCKKMLSRAKRVDNTALEKVKEEGTA